MASRSSGGSVEPDVRLWLTIRMLSRAPYLDTIMFCRVATSTIYEDIANINRRIIRPGLPFQQNELQNLALSSRAPSAAEVTIWQHSTGSVLRYRGSWTCTDPEIVSRLPSSAELGNMQQYDAQLFPTQLKRYLQDPVYAAGTICSYCHLELDEYGHTALATCTHKLSPRHRHNTLTKVIRRWVFMVARFYLDYETRALVSHSTDRPADLLVLV
jgi:hypothetical protein